MKDHSLWVAVVMAALIVLGISGWTPFERAIDTAYEYKHGGR